MDGAYPRLLVTDLVGRRDNLILGVGQNQIAVLAHNFDIQVPLGRVAGARAKLEVKHPFPGGHWRDRHQDSLVQLVLELLAKGKGVLTFGGGLPQVQARRLGMP